MRVFAAPAGMKVEVACGAVRPGRAVEIEYEGEAVGRVEFRAADERR